MGKLFGNLTNTALSDPSKGQEIFAPKPSQVSAAFGQTAQPAGSNIDATSVDQNPETSFQPTPQGPQPQLSKPSFAQAAGVGAQPGGVNAMSPGLSKGGKLVALLRSGLTGALSGMAANAQTYAATGRNAGFGGGAEAGYTQSLPFLRNYQSQQLQRGGLENQLLQSEVQYAPLLQRLGLLKTQADIGKTQAETGKDTAETAAIPTRQALEAAQTEAANYKDDPNLGLIDLRTKQPVSSAGLAPLSPEEATILGKQEGERVPLKLKNTANEMVNRGIRTTQAGGRSLLVDNKGNTIKDMGAATPVVTMNMQNPMSGSPFPVATGSDALKGMTPQQQTLVKGIANYEIDPNDFMSKRNPAAGAQLIASVKQFDPSYDQTQYGTKSVLRKSFTSGTDSQNVQALNTVAHHLNMLDKAADGLNNGDVQTLNQIGNAYNVKVAGKSPAVVFNAIKNAVSGELGNVFKKSGATDPEIASIGSTISDSLSKGITKDVISADVGLVQGRLKALQFKYENGMQKPADFRIISPEAEATFNRLGAGGGAGGRGGKGGVQVTDPRGTVHTFPDQASANSFKKAAGIQ